MKNLFLPLLVIICLSCGAQANEGSSAPPGKTGDDPDATSNQEELKKNKGIGPVTTLELGDLDQALADQGKAIYNTMCSACHVVDRDYTGPSPKGILDRRSPEWVMNMILNPTEMLEKDPIAKGLLEEYNGIPMVNMGLTQEEARSILEYFRTID